MTRTKLILAVFVVLIVIGKLFHSGSHATHADPGTSTPASSASSTRVDTADTRTATSGATASASKSLTDTVFARHDTYRYDFEGRHVYLVEHVPFCESQVNRNDTSAGATILGGLMLQGNEVLAVGCGLAPYGNVAAGATIVWGPPIGHAVDVPTARLQRSVDYTDPELSIVFDKLGLLDD